jgi:hypothetical protein
MRISHWWPNRPNLLKIAIAGFVYAGKQCWLTMIGNHKKWIGASSADGKTSNNQVR